MKFDGIVIDNLGFDNLEIDKIRLHGNWFITPQKMFNIIYTTAR